MFTIKVLSKIFISISFCILVLISIINCQPQHNSNLNSETNTTLEKSTLGFAEINQILKYNCTNCHTGRHQIFENYNFVKSSLPEILRRVRSQQNNYRMPPNGPSLSADQIATLQAWSNFGAPEFKSQEPIQPAPNRVDFKTIQQKVFTANCIGCHSQYQDESVARADRFKILAQTLNDKMPFPARKGLKVIPLTREQKSLIGQWVEFENSKPDKKPNSELKPNWISLRNHVFGPKCILCHNSVGSRAPFSMSTYEELKSWLNKNPKLFNFKEPSKSHFIGAILGRVDEENEEYFFDSMPFVSDEDDVNIQIPSVTENELKMIEQWIALGIPKE